MILVIFCIRHVSAETPCDILGLQASSRLGVCGFATGCSLLPVSCGFSGRFKVDEKNRYFDLFLSRFGASAEISRDGLGLPMISEVFAGGTPL